MPTPYSAYGCFEREFETQKTLIRKTSLQDRTDSFCGQAQADIAPRLVSSTRQSAGSAYRARSCDHHDTRNDLLFTMSDTTRLVRTPMRQEPMGP
jgi:hypothetical protein